MLFLILFAGLAQDLPDGPGKETVLKICRDCHDLDTITAENRTKEGWKKTVAKMGDRGAEGTDEQFEAVVVYLTKYFGRINVNTATAEEIAAGLDFSAKEAESIVQYREKNGAYKNWKDLNAVIDAAKVEARKNHIAVQ
ncbi:MAG: helix-hairpin-helix domain-containing protein [Bryobacteraceae bacterium]|jgi:competence protein ComEA